MTGTFYPHSHYCPSQDLEDRLSVVRIIIGGLVKLQTVCTVVQPQRDTSPKPVPSSNTTAARDLALGLKCGVYIQEDVLQCWTTAWWWPSVGDNCDTSVSIVNCVVPPATIDCPCDMCSGDYYRGGHIIFRTPVSILNIFNLRTYLPDVPFADMAGEQTPASVTRWILLLLVWSLCVLVTGQGGVHKR